MTDKPNYDAANLDALLSKALTDRELISKILIRCPSINEARQALCDFLEGTVTSLALTELNPLTLISRYSDGQVFGDAVPDRANPEVHNYYVHFNGVPFFQHFQGIVCSY